MNIKKLDKLRKKIENLRRKGGIRPAEMESLAKSCGRVKIKRGKEPTWVNKDIPTLRPLSIPHHGELNRITARNILNHLENDLDVIECLLITPKEGGEK